MKPQMWLKNMQAVLTQKIYMSPGPSEKEGMYLYLNEKQKLKTTHQLYRDILDKVNGEGVDTNVHVHVHFNELHHHHWLGVSGKTLKVYRKPNAGMYVPINIDVCTVVLR